MWPQQVAIVSVLSVWGAQCSMSKDMHACLNPAIDDNAVNTQAINTSTDRKAYIREYMRKRRGARAGSQGNLDRSLIGSLRVITLS